MMDGSGLNPGMIGFRKQFLSAMFLYQGCFAIDDILRSSEDCVCSSLVSTELIESWGNPALLLILRAATCTLKVI